MAQQLTLLEDRADEIVELVANKDFESVTQRVESFNTAYGEADVFLNTATLNPSLVAGYSASLAGVRGVVQGVLRATEKIAASKSYTSSAPPLSFSVPSSTQQDNGSSTAGSSTEFQQTSSQQSLSLHPPPMFKMKALEIPVFNGDLKDWRRFWQIFEINVDKRGYSKQEKINYLDRHLTGVAKETIEGYDLIGENYDLVIEELHRTFGDVKQLAHNYTDQLKDMPMAVTAAEKRRNFNSIKKLLNNMGVDAKLENALLERIILTKFDERVHEFAVMELVKAAEPNQSYPLEQVLKCLDLVIRRGELVASQRAAIQPTTSSKFISSGTNVKRLPLAASLVASTSKVNADSCGLCNKSNHATKDCFAHLGVSIRKARLTELRKCLLCGESGHLAGSCSLNGRPCGRCNRKGHSIITCIDHMESLSARQKSKTRKRPAGTFLESFVGSLKLDSGVLVPFRGVMDSCSSVSFISQSFVRKWRLKVCEPHQMNIGRFGSNEPFTFESGFVQATLADRAGKNERNFEMLVTPCITGDIDTCPSSDIVRSALPQSLNYADPQIFDVQKDPIDITIGNNFQFTVFSGKHRTLNNGVTLRHSMFGWIPSGPVDISSESGSTLSLTAVASPSNINSNCSDASSSEISYSLPNFDVDSASLEQLWSLEALGIKASEVKNDDEAVLKNIRETMFFDKGRYNVRWPWKQDPPRLATNYRMCIARLRSMVSRLSKNELSKYDAAINEQLAEGIVEKVPSNSKYPKHYLPHRAIEQKGKLRLVYDGSAKASGGQSINNLMYKGPSLTENLVGLLLKFRLYPVGLTADIKKAFLQIALNEVDRDVVRFIWLKDPLGPVKDDNLLILRFARVPFGIIASPFLLNIVLQDHLDSPPSNQWHSSVKDKFYVDNLVMSVKNYSTALSVHNAVTSKLMEASFTLRDWTSNDTNFLKAIGAPLDLTERISVLGLYWDRAQDVLYIRLPTQKSNVDLTKKLLLHYYASIFDPLGMFNPVTLPLKLLIQECWKDKFEWGAVLPQRIVAKWLKIQSMLSDIPKIAIPRRYFPTVPNGPLTLHIFCDASSDAYACCAYLTYADQINSDEKPALVYSKARVAPPNLRREVPTSEPQDIPMTIPKLELLGVLIGKRASTFLKTHFEIEKTILWTDSSTVLQWLNSCQVLPQFILNRVSEIKKTPNLLIRFVPGSENPADVATRGCSAESIKHDQGWWHGPEWLTCEPLWPSLPPNTEVFKTPVLALIAGKAKPVASSNLPDKVEKGFPSWDAALDHFKEINSKDSDPNLVLSSLEIHNNAETSLLLELQKKYFDRERKTLEAGLTPSSNLSLFVLGDGLIRCGGRLQNASFPWDTVHPILLPRESPITRLYLQKIHEDNHHIGANHLINKLRERFWIVRIRPLANSVIHRCQTCRRWEGGPYQLPPMVPLPLARVTEASAFLHVGVDYMGPVYIYDKGAEPQAVYVALFVCLVTRAIHLETARDLSGEEFLYCLVRFCSRRGLPKIMISDNATNFSFIQPLVGEKIQVMDGKVDTFLNSGRIMWKFIPTYSPWHGGAYERLVSLIKRSLKKSYGFQYLDLMQFITALTCIENTINSRPLTYVSSNETLSSLTPNHFLRLRNVNALEQIDVSAGPLPSTTVHLLAAWGHITSVIDSFWEVFRSQYLTSLRERHATLHKPVKGSLPFVPNVGDVVLIKEHNAPRSFWKSGVIRHLANRKTLATIESEGKTLLRSINHLYPLELPNADTHVEIPKASRGGNEQPGEASKRRRRC